MDDFTVTQPVSLSDDQVWVFIQDSDALYAARIVYNPVGCEFGALITDVFNTNSIMPSYWDGDLCQTVRWATTKDIEAHADMFNQAY